MNRQIQNYETVTLMALLVKGVVQVITEDAWNRMFREVNSFACFRFNGNILGVFQGFDAVPIAKADAFQNYEIPDA